MQINITLTDIQQIKKLQFSLDLEKNSLICIAGKNGAGKTTLVKAIRNIINADTFKKTSPDGIFRSTSSIAYEIDGHKITFDYDNTLKSLNCRDKIPDAVRSLISVELPIPYGERFNFFQRISNADSDIRRSMILNQYTIPNELINFLEEIYQNKEFESLVETAIKDSKYYCKLISNPKYIREDYFSSGEYFLISLYKRIIKGGCRLIVIDEIDISLDAAAQVRLVKMLRDFSKKYNVGFVFTTHSLAMMRTLEPHELFFMQQESSTEVTSIDNVSYSYIKTILFCFKGWDKYILTEDVVLKEFIDYIIKKYCQDIFFRYKIIYIGGATNTIDLMKRNEKHCFLSAPENVITILDGDQRDRRFVKNSNKKNIHCIPIMSVEKALFDEYNLGVFEDKMIKIEEELNPKSLYNFLIKQKIMSHQKIFEHLCEKNSSAISDFSKTLSHFLKQPMK